MPITLEGSTDWQATDRSPHSVHLVLVSDSAIEPDCQFTVRFGQFRGLWNGNWSCDTVTCSAGEAQITQNVPQAFHAFGTARTVPNRQRLRFCVARVTQRIPAGATVTFAITGQAQPFAPLAMYFSIWLLAPGADEATSLGDEVELCVVPGESERFELRAAASAIDGRVAVRMLHTDACGNPTDDLDGRLEAAAGIAQASDEAVTFADDVPSVFRLTATSRQARATSGPILTKPLAGHWHLFGAMHFHTEFSADGDRRLEQAYAYARDCLRLDFCAVSDHTPRDHWEETQRINEAFYEPGRFVTIPAWEWSTNIGHANIYMRSAEVDAGPNSAACAGAGHPADAVWPNDAIVIPHHTNIRSNEKRADGRHFWHEYDWSKRNDRIRLVEVAQTRGNFEADKIDEEWGIVTGNIGASVRDALAMGYRIGMVGGTDNHGGYPTRHMDGRYLGMTGVLANERTREAVWDALNARRCYATTGLPIVCHFAINDAVMGSEITLAKGARPRACIRLHGTSLIERVEVISDNSCIWSADPRVMDFECDVQLPPQSGASAYYYVRLRQADGHRAWTSPIWVDHA